MRSSTNTIRSSCSAPIFVRGRWSLIALAATTAFAVGMGSVARVQAHEDRRSNQSDKLPATAELILPQLEPGTYRLILRKAEDSDTVGSFKRQSDFDDAPRPQWRDRAPSFSLRVPNEPAPRRVVKPAFQVRPGEIDTLSIPKNFAMIDAPRRVVAQKRFEAGWSGPNVSGDRLELLAQGQRACADSVLGISVHEYDANRDGEFTFLAPMRPGSYEIVYCSVNQGRVLARHPIQVVARTVASVRTTRVSRLRASSEGDRTSTRPSFELNSSVDDTNGKRDALPRVRMFAPLASARTSDLEDARPSGPVFTVRPRRFAEAAPENDDVVTPVGRYRFKATRQARSTTLKPVFSVRPEFEEADDARNSSGEDDTRAELINPDEDDVIDIAPRRRASFDDDVKDKKLPRVRIFVDDEPTDTEAAENQTRKVKAPIFDEADVFDVVAPRTRTESREARATFEDDSNEDRALGQKPSFDDDDAFDRPKGQSFADRIDEERSKRVARTPKFGDRPTFTDDGFSSDTPKETRQAKLPSFEDSGPVERADDFKDGEVDVASAIARNLARYGDGRDDRDDFFSIKGRYSWYKPVEPKQDDRTAKIPVQNTDRDDAFDDRTDDRRRNTNRDDRDNAREDNSGRVIELNGRDAFEDSDNRRRPIIAALPKPKSLPQERDFDRFSDGTDGDDSAVFGPPVRDDARRFASRNTDDLDLSNDKSDFDASSRTGAATGPIAMVRKTDNTQVAPQFDRIQPVKAGYRFAAGWTGDIRRKGWIAVARNNARIDDYLSLRSADAKGELKFRAPSEPGRYELRFLSRDRRVVLARQSFEVEAAPVRLVALEFVDPADELNVWWAGPGDGTDSLTLARVGAQDSRYLSKQSVGKGNPLTLKAPTQPGTYEMRYVNGTDNRVLFRRKLIVAESQPKLLGP